MERHGRDRSTRLAESSAKTVRESHRCEGVALVPALVGTVGTDTFGRFAEPQFFQTPWGELAQANVATAGRASDEDFALSAQFVGTQSAGNGDTIFRLREGIERFIVTDINNPAASAQAASTVPLMWDHISANVKDFSHVPGGGNVVYLDGHTKFITYPGKQFPLSEDSSRLLGRYGKPFDGF